MDTARPKVAIIVVPRERYGLTEVCLDHLYAFTDQPFQLIVVDGNAPEPVRSRLRRLGETRENLEIIRFGKYLYPHEAKQLALANLKETIEWIVFIDNDVKVSPHWLASMLTAAKESNARVAHPFYLIEQKQGVSIHMAEGKFLKVKKNGLEWTQPVMNCNGENIIRMHSFSRQVSAFVEFHCFMIRRDLLGQMLPFESIHLAEDMHFSLKLKEIGEKIIFEPNSVITYVAGPPFDSCDLEYFKWRRDLQAGADSVKMLIAKWPTVLESYWMSKITWLQFHRSRISPLFPLISKLRRMSPYSKTARFLARSMGVVGRRRAVQGAKRA